MGSDSEEYNNTAKTTSWKNVVKCPHIASLVLIAFVAVGTLTPMHQYDTVFDISNLVFLKEKQIHVGSSENGPIPGCVLFSGKWVYDNVSYPLYKEGQCSFLGNKFPACQTDGRKVLKFQNWRWQPHHCDIPRLMLIKSNIFKLNRLQVGHTYHINYLFVRMVTIRE